MSAPYDVRSVEYVGAFRLKVMFADGSSRVIDLESKLSGPVGPIFEPLKDPSYFARATVDPESQTVVWPNGADLAPDVMHSGALDVTSAA